MFQRSSSGSVARGEEAARHLQRRSTTSDRGEEATSPSSSPFAFQPSGRRASWSGAGAPREQLGAERSFRRRQSSGGGDEPMGGSSPRSESLSGGFSNLFSKSPSPQLESLDEKSPYLSSRAGSDPMGFRQMHHSPPPLLQLPRAQKVPIQVQTGKPISNSSTDDSKRAKQMGFLAGAASLVAVYSASTVL